MHELGHAVGLAHPLVDDPSEIMYHRMRGKSPTWGAGDRTGLEAIGASGGCLTTTANINNAKVQLARQAPA
jgi:hypothetical protein